MSEYGFQRSNFDCCVYFKGVEDDTKIYLLLYVDDILIKCQQINILNQQLREVFEMKDLGVAKKIIRVEIIRDINEGILYLTQQKYIRKVLEKFDM